ncbi:hypothetical protein CKK33_00090 [Mucilaginibacter sp. MD40]|uniref:hypothetical protein n=1 Tax=Mucilaginibacter sp. MD40 TaxID=2029590 RepID=UPI000BACC7A5|nr:hypothetical protein [Mucilaginibacter sp. MD40]PAW91977.1 hypothetical protein CKK33_00090 [Mucilaginibacter sp. MD40]
MRRKIQDIAPSLLDHFIEIERYNLQDKSEVLKQSRQTLGRYYDYLGRLHDCWIIENTLVEQNFVLRLNDITTHIFADALISKKNLKVNEDDLVFRVNVDFQVSNLTFNTVDEDGSINEIKPLVLDEYLDEEIISVTDKLIKIGIVAWVKSQRRKPGHYVLVLFDAKKVTVDEYQDQDWERIFNNNYDRYYNKFKAELLNGKFLSDQSVCEKFIDEIDETIG